MTREERINSALLPILEKMREHGATDEMCKMYDNGFHVGAMWADANPRWISVEDELPPIFPLNPNESMNVITYGLHTMVNWYDYERGEWVRDSEITHWMPLPQPPHHFADVSQKVKKGGDE